MVAIGEQQLIIRHHSVNIKIVVYVAHSCLLVKVFLRLVFEKVRVQFDLGHVWLMDTFAE